MENFTAAIDSWESAYQLIGGMAATLTGLLFVALSLNVKAIMSPDNPDLRLTAIRTFNQFLLIIEISIVMLIPLETPVTLGASIAALAAISIGTTYFASREQSGPARPPIRSALLTYVLFVGFLVVGLLLTIDQPGALFLMLSLVIGMLMTSVFSAWSLLVEVGQDDTT